MRGLMHRDHLIVTILAFAFMAFFAVVTVSVSFLNPMAQAYSNYSLSDMYYQIERYGVKPDTSELITIVDMTELYERGDLANMLFELSEMEPRAVGMDVIFEGVRDDATGNSALMDAVQTLGDNVVFTLKLKDYDGEKGQFTNITRSFFTDSIKVKQGYANLPDNMEARNIRNYTVRQRMNDSTMLSFPYMVAQLIDKDVKASDKLLRINYGNNVFPVVKASELQDHQDLIEGRVVMIGTMGEEQDMHLSPLGKMAGIEIQAYSLQTILERKDITDAPAWLNYVLAFIVCLLFELSMWAVDQFCKNHSKNAAVVFMDKSALLSTIVVTAWLILISWGGYVVFKHSSVYIDTKLLLALTAMVIVARKYYGAFIKTWAANHSNKFIETSLFK